MISALPPLAEEANDFADSLPNQGGTLGGTRTETLALAEQKQTASSGVALNSDSLAACADLVNRAGSAYIYRGHLDPDDALVLLRANIRSLYNPKVGGLLASGIKEVRGNCSSGNCLNCVWRAFDQKLKGAWPVEEDANTINNGQCARSFTDYWQERYESRMKIKRVWWGAGDSRNLITDPYDLPLGSVVVWDVCGTEQQCPGGWGIGDIGIISSVNGGPQIESFYAPLPLKDQDSHCRKKGKLAGIFIPWSG